MGAGAKLDRHRTEWIVYATFCALIELVWRDYSLVDAVVRVGLTAAVAWYLIRELHQKSSLVWAFGVVFGVTGAVGGSVALIIAIREIIAGGDLHANVVLLAASIVIHVRMFRTLRDAEVKHFVMLA